MQPRVFWEVLGKQPGQQENFVYDVSVDLKGAVQEVRLQTYGTLNRTCDANEEANKNEATFKRID